MLLLKQNWLQIFFAVKASATKAAKFCRQIQRYLAYHIGCVFLFQTRLI